MVSRRQPVDDDPTFRPWYHLRLRRCLTLILRIFVSSHVRHIPRYVLVWLSVILFGVILNWEAWRSKLRDISGTAEVVSVLHNAAYTRAPPPCDVCIHPTNGMCRIRASCMSLN